MQKVMNTSLSDPFAGFGSQGLGNNGFEVSLNYISGLPDANILSDPKLKIIFKSMLKKDDTTKEKLLLDLLKLLDDDSQTQLLNDDLVIISWVQLYPKLAFDISKNVRLNAHQVQSKFAKLLGKRYAKYLKDTAPIWLAGLYDTERLVSKAVLASLTFVFQSQEKVDILWKLFAGQILNFCYQIIKFETVDTLSDERNVGKDEAKAKYDRVVLCAVSVFNKLLSFPDLDSNSQTLKDLLASEELWEISTSKDLNLKKSFLMMIVTLIKIQPGLIDDHLFKIISKSIFKSLKYKPATNNIIYSLIVLPTLSVILNAVNFNADVWSLAGKKSKEKFFAFLELGSCHTSEIYYELLESILLKTSNDIIDYKDEADFKRISDILVKDLEQEKLIPFNNKAWNCFLSTEAKFYEFQPLVVTSYLKPVLQKNLETKISKDVLKSLILFYKTIGDYATLFHLTDIVIDSFPNKPSNSTFIGNVFDILNESHSDKLDSLVQESFKSLEDVDEEGEEYNPPVSSFVVFDKIISRNVKKYKSEIDTLLEVSLVSFVEKNFIEVPLSLLICYNNNKDFLDSHILNETFNSLFSKLLMIDEELVQIALAKIPKLTNLEVDSCQDVQAFIVNKSQEFNYVDASKNQNLIFNFLTKDVFINLFRQSLEAQSEEVFIAEFLSKFDKNLLNEFLKSEDSTVPLFFKYLFQTISKENSARLLQAIDSESILMENLVLYVSKFPFVEIDPILVFLKEFKTDLIGKLIPNNFEEILTAINLAVGDLVDLRLSLANPLEGNIFLVSEEIASSFDQLKSAELILYSRFLVALLQLREDVDSKVVACLAVVGEIAQDYCFLSAGDNEEIMSFANLSNQLLMKTFKSIELGQLIEVLFNEKEEDSNDLLQFFNSYTDGRSLISYYFNRVVKFLLTNMIDATSLQNFESLDINFNKLMKKPLKLATLIISCKQFLTSSKLERVRNSVASELIGLKTSQIMGKGLTNLSILNNFLLCDSSNFGIENFVPIPEQRFNMVLRDLNNWLESDIAYDEKFVLIRIQLTSFISSYISLAKLSSQLDISKVLELGLSLFRDSIGLVVLEQANDSLTTLIIPLRYFSLKLFVLLERNKDDIEAWKEECEGIYEELIESLVHYPVPSEVNQPLSMTYELYYKIFDTLVPLKFIEEKDFYELLDSKGDLQKLGVSVLDRSILAHQQDYVIEYELEMSKLSTESLQDNSTNLAKLPQILIDNISQIPEEYVEYEEVSKMNKFLYSWYLIFDHFKDITQRMREDYIKQLNPQMDQFFKFVFEQIDLATDMDLIKKLSSSNQIKEYEFSTGDYELSQIELQKHLIIHLYYLSLENVRSLAQSWFQTIRSRQLKGLIENFTINYISPIVIDNEMNKATSLIHSKSFNEENLTVKINRVTHEIKSSYLIDEKTMEMVIKIPASYPFQNVIVDGPMRLGVKETQWKSWLLASQRVINAQNSTIIGAIELFNKNVSLHFSGFEECAICYSILHYQDNSLPSKTCTTCNNKFHAACLYKWFKSSGGSTCPLCRSTFNFRK